MPFRKRDNIVPVRIPTRLPAVALEAASQTVYTAIKRFGGTFKRAAQTGCRAGPRCSAADRRHSRRLRLTLASAGPGGRDKVGPPAASSEDGPSDGRANAQTRLSRKDVYVQRSRFCSETSSEYFIYKHASAGLFTFCSQQQLQPHSDYFYISCHFPYKSLSNRFESFQNYPENDSTVASRAGCWSVSVRL